MNKEIELKARVKQPEPLKKRLEALYGTAETILKDDIYYKYARINGAENEQPVRLRVENGRNIVTLKRKTVENGIETNDELEFGISDTTAFLEFLKLTGAVKWLEKNKRGWGVHAAVKGFNAVIELCEVSSLGWFIEIEIVLEETEEERINQAAGLLLEILGQIGIPEDEIEPRYYSEMLLEKKDPPDSTNRTGKGG